MNKKIVSAGAQLRTCTLNHIGETPIVSPKKKKAILHSRARKLLDVGLSVFPIQSDKKPVLKKDGSRYGWTTYQNKPIAKSKLEEILGNENAEGLALVCGFASGDWTTDRKHPLNGVEVVDIDTKHDPTQSIHKHLFQAIAEGNPKLLKRLVIQQTQSGGYHIIYKAPFVGRNEKLAKIKQPNGKFAEVLETRANGGYIAIAPTAGYTFTQGNLSKLPVISIDERNWLIEVCKSFDQSPTKPKAKPQGQARAEAESSCEPSEDALQKYLRQMYRNALNPSISSSDGGKHEGLRTSARTLGGYVGAGLLDRAEAERMLEKSIENKDVKDWSNARTTIKNGLDHGITSAFNADDIKRKVYKSTLPKPVDGAYWFDDYLPKEVIAYILNAKTGAGRISIEAPTGSGKTYSILNELERVTSKTNKRALVVLPYKALPSQIKNEYPFAHAITGDSTKEEIEESHSARIVVATYDSAFKAMHYDPQEYDYLIVDEAHNLVNQYGFRSEALEVVWNLVDGGFQETVILISATPNPMFSKMLGFKPIKFKRRKNPKITVKDLRYNGKKGSAKDVMVWQLMNTDFSKGKVVVKVNSKDAINELRRAVIEAGILQPNEIGFIYDCDTIEQNEDYRSIIDHSMIKEETKLLFTTSKINDGVNINNTDIAEVYVIGERCTDSFIQFCARFRKMASIPVTSIRAEGEEKEAPKATLEILSNRYFADAHIVARTMNEQQAELETLGIAKNRIAPSAGDHVKFDGKQYKPAPLACLFSAKTQMDSITTVDQFYKSLGCQAPYMEIGQAISIEASKSPLLKKAQELTKIEKEGAFEKGKEAFADNIKAFLTYLYFFTKDVQLKRAVKQWFGFEPTRTPESQTFEKHYGYLLEVDKVKRIGVVFLRLCRWGFSESQACKMVMNGELLSTGKFGKFASAFTLQFAREVLAKVGKDALEPSLFREIEMIDKGIAKVCELGQEFEAKEAHKAINKPRRFLADKLNPSNAGNLIDILFNVEAKTKTGAGNVAYKIGGLKGVKELAKIAQLSEVEILEVFKVGIANYLKNRGFDSESASNDVRTPSADVINISVGGVRSDDADFWDRIEAQMNSRGAKRKLSSDPIEIPSLDYCPF